MDLKFLFIGTVLFINKITSSPIISYYNNKEGIIKDVEENTIGRYEVTENVIDVPDDRTLAPIIANFSLTSGLNYGNATVKQNKTHIDKEDNWNKEETNPNNEAVNIANKPIKVETLDKDKGNNFKKNQFSILHIKAEYEDNQNVDTNDKCQHVFRCLKDYLYGVKKGVVDGIHSFFGGHKEKPNSILDKFHRSASSDDFDESDERHSFSDEFSDEFGDDFIDDFKH